MQYMMDCEQDRIHEIQWRKQNELDRRDYEQLKMEENLDDILQDQTKKET